MITYNKIINKYHDYLYDLRDTLPKKSMIDFGTAIINKYKKKRNRRK